jgi:hypothetical protein
MRARLLDPDGVRLDQSCPHAMGGPTVEGNWVQPRSLVSKVLQLFGFPDWYPVPYHF